MTSIPIEKVRLYRMVMADHQCPWGLKAEALLKQQGKTREARELQAKFGGSASRK